MDIFQSNINVI